jgi:hypothetical protein
MDEGMGNHAIRKERIPRAPCRRLFQSRTAVRPLPLYQLRLLTRFMQRFGLPLQARARPLARPRIAGDTAFRARRNRNCVVQSNHLRLRPALQARRRPRRTVTPALRAPADIPQWRAGRPTRLARHARRHCDGIRCVVFPPISSTQLSDDVVAGLDAAQLERKIRLLALADLGFQNIGQDLPYAQVSASLQVPATQVERWVIDGKSPPTPLKVMNSH